MQNPAVVHRRSVLCLSGVQASRCSWVPPAYVQYGTQEDIPATGSAAEPQWTSPPRQLELAPPGAAEFVICDHTIELLFKEWKSYANLHAFDTENPAIVEGLIWTAIAAAALKRFLAHMTQLLTAVPMSTRKVAMCAVHVLGGIVQALKTGDMAGLYDALEAAITYLAGHAQRAHPARDRQTGRSQLGLEPLLGSNDRIELSDSA